jgi:hypothetical protein
MKSCQQVSEQILGHGAYACARLDGDQLTGETVHGTHACALLTTQMNSSPRSHQGAHIPCSTSARSGTRRRRVLSTQTRRPPTAAVAPRTTSPGTSTMPRVATVAAGRAGTPWARDLGSAGSLPSDTPLAPPLPELLPRCQRGPDGGLWGLRPRHAARQLVGQGAGASRLRGLLLRPWRGLRLPRPRPCGGASIWHEGGRVCRHTHRRSRWGGRDARGGFGSDAYGLFVVHTARVTCLTLHQWRANGRLWPRPSRRALWRWARRPPGLWTSSIARRRPQ